MSSKTVGRVQPKESDSHTYKIGRTLSAQEALDVVQAICADEVDALVVTNGGEERIDVLREAFDPGEYALETVRALREGEVDGIVVCGSKGEEIYLLQGADSPYRVVVEAMSEGAALVTPDTCILHCNAALAGLIGKSAAELVNVEMESLVWPEDRRAFEDMVRRAARQTARVELRLRSPEGGELPVALSLGDYPESVLPSPRRSGSDHRCAGHDSRDIR